MSKREKTGLAVYNLLLALWVGGIFIYTFLVTPVVFRSFGRDTASMIVDKLFPFYLPYMLVTICLALGAFLLSGWKRGARPKLVVGSLGVAVMITVLVTFWLYPEVGKIKQELSSLEKTAVDSPARKRFMDLHGISMILNLVLLVDGIALIVIDSFSKREH